MSLRPTGNKQVDDTLRGVVRTLKTLPQGEAEATEEGQSNA